MDPQCTEAGDGLGLRRRKGYHHFRRRRLQQQAVLMKHMFNKVNSIEDEHEASVPMRPHSTARTNKAAATVIGIEICKFCTYHAYGAVSNHLGFS